jgi:hypothetical protein
MSISARALNRATLGRQLLLRREPLCVEDAVRLVVALQAQDPASPYIALWNRISDFNPGELDIAFAEYRVVRATMMRITMHAVHVADYREFREAMESTLRGSRLRDRRFIASGLTEADVDDLISPLFDFAAQPRTASELQAWLDQRLGGEAHRSVWWALRQYAPLVHVPNGSPWSFVTDRSYVSAPARPVLADSDASHAALQTLIIRYLEGFGPASMPDISQFALIYRSLVKPALQAIADQLEQLKAPDGKVLYDLPGAWRPDEETTVPPRLLGMWDNILLAYVDRSRVIPPQYRKHVTRINGDTLPTLLVDGYVAGVWRVVDRGIEASAFHPLSEAAWEGLAAEAESLLALLAARKADVYRRYDHWWQKDIPAAEVRILPDD